MKRVLAVFLAVLFLAVSMYSQEGNNQSNQTNQNAQSSTTGAAATSAPSASAAAQSTSAPEETSGPVNLGTIVVGAMPYGVSLRDLPYNVDVITRQDIENSGAVNIADAFKNTVGTILQSLGGFNALQSIRLRGGTTNQTAILINGVKIVNDFSNSAYLTQFGAELFESIEIMRGNGSVFYGLGANFGVVNFTTRQVKEGTHATMGTVFAGGGLQGFFKGYLTSSYGNKNFKMLGSFSYLEQGAVKIPKIDSSLIGTIPSTTRENSDATITNVMFTTGYTTDSKKFYTDFTGIVTKHSYGASGSDQYPDTDNRFLKRDYILILNAGYKLGEMIELKLKSFFNYTKYEDMNIASSTSYDIFRYQRPGFEVQTVIKPFKKFVAVVGVGHEWQRYHKNAEINPYGAPEDLGPLNARILSAFVHFDYSVSIVQFMGGARIDHHTSSNTDKLKSFGSLVSLQAGALVTIIGDTLKARVQVSR
jgi:outer membrane cobalamin receptor